MTKKSIPRKIMASVLVLMMLFATTGLVMADSITITSFEKIEEEDGGLNPSIDVSDLDFVVIKQARFAIIWTKDSLTEDEQNELLDQLGKSGKDPSLKSSTVEFTTAMEFSFSKFGKDTYITIENDVLTINGDYSHYNIGTYNRGGGGEEPDSFALTVEKVWEDAEGLTINPPGDISITINVLKDGQLTDLSATFPEDDETPWSHTFEGLEEGKYSVEEATVPSGFSVFYSPEEVYLSANNAADTIVVTNTEDGDEPGEPESYELTVVKEWVGDDENDRPDKITFNLIKLYGNDEFDVVEENVELTKDSWSRTFNDLGPGTYAVEEISVDGYEVKYSDPVTLDVEKSTSGTITITNTKESEPPVEPEKPELTITKTVTPASRVGSSGTFTYTLVVKNNGEETLFSVVVEDVFTGPAGATYTYNYSGGDDEPTFDPETNTFFLGDMEGGATITITYTVDITGRGTHDNKATVRGWTELEDELTDDDDASVELRRSGGGGGGDNPTPTPTPTPPVDIPEEPIPEGPAPVDDSTVEILEEEVPLSPVPKTGVNDNIALMALLMLGSLAGIGALTIRRRSVER